MGRSAPFSEVNVQSTPQSAGGNDVAKDERCIISQVHPSAGLSDKETRNNVQSFPTIQPCKISVVVVIFIHI